MLPAESGPGQGVKACAEPVAVENAGVETDSSVSLSPLKLQGGPKGVGVQTPGGPGKTAERMAQALRYCESFDHTSCILQHCHKG